MVMLTTYTMTNCVTNVINKQSHGLECNFGNNCMATWAFNYTPVADLGGARGAVAPPPLGISGHTKGWLCCYKNT